MFLIPESLNIHNANDVREQLLGYVEQLEKEREIVFDASALQDMDIAGLQLLLSACKTFQAESRSFSFNNISVFGRHVFHVAGVVDVIENKDSSYAAATH